VTKEELERLYNEELLTETEIAVRVGLSQAQVGRLRKRWGIPTLGKSGRLEKGLPPLTPRQKELLIGSLLGDGWMSASSNMSARFSEGHTSRAGAYTWWKATEMAPYTTRVFQATKREGDRIFKSIVMGTHSCPQLRPFYDLFYPPPHRKRVFPSNIHELMTPFVLAVWYMDDGSVTQRGEPQITFGLGEISRRRAIKALIGLGLKPRVYGTGVQTIAFPRQKMEFRALVEPHLHPYMLYKLPRDMLPGQQVHRNARQLKSEKAADLYQHGMSVAKIADLFDVGQSTVARRLQKAGVCRCQRPGPKGSDQGSAETLLSAYDPSQWASLSTPQQEVWVEEVYQIMRDLLFPTPSKLKGEQAQVQFLKIQSAEMTLQDGVIHPNRRAGLNLCTSYFPNRYRARSKKQPSAFEAWHDEKLLKRAIRFQLKVGDPVLPHRVLKAVTMNCRTPTVFRPTTARFIYERYCPPGGKVWDPCAGYGGRLLGALAAGVHYTGTDVDAETIAGNQHLLDVLGKEAVLVQTAAETFDPPDVDVVFTSPPYFHQERYAGGQGQSWRQYQGLDEWLEGFLRKVLRGAAAHSPCVILNVADVSGVPLVEHTKRIAQEEGLRLQETLWMPLAALNRKRPKEPVLVFRH